jgi:VIT1/CCC1 family predicted Fe2+/Mn2+ transporter
MKVISWVLRREHTFPLIIGLADGILTALTLTAGRVIHSQPGVDSTLAFRVPLASSLSGAFVFFVAEYGRLRGELVYAERQLNLPTYGSFAASRLGRAVFREAVGGAVISCVCNFLGALLPLLFIVLLPESSWLAIVIAITALGALGVGVAYVVHGNLARWAGALIIAGVLLTFVGTELHII